MAFSHRVIVPDVIVDNDDPEFSVDAGTWETWEDDPGEEGCIYVGDNFRYHPAGTEAYSATWQVRSDMPAGTYRVYAIWCANTYREDQVDYTINHSGGSTVVGPFDQRQNNGVWVD